MLLVRCRLLPSCGTARGCPAASDALAGTGLFLQEQATSLPKAQSGQISPQGF